MKVLFYSAKIYDKKSFDNAKDAFPEIEIEYIEHELEPRTAALVNTTELIEGIRMRKFLGVGLDVYEEETGNVYEDRSDDIMEHSVTARLLAFPNVMITSHQGFYTLEALANIAETTLQNLMDAKEGKRTPNDVA